ncbi:MAG TPA: HAD-IC family P-type ATPase [Longimicrobiales bacterium]|nr:HAD-IC family P-type ATPase [Longimicrobiales bacterium]
MASGMDGPARSTAHPAGTAPSDAWHATSPDDLLRNLNSDPDGLTQQDAVRRLEQYGPNSLRTGKPVSAWRILGDQFRSVVVLLLVVATGVAWLIGDPIEAIAILGVLVINATIGFVTEFRARGAMAALLRLEVPKATVLRDGDRQEVESTSLVPGDVIIVEAGQAVPADARLIKAAELRTNEAPLTGESLPVDKDAEATLPPDTSLAERTTAIYMSTAVVAGSGRAVVTATGMQTEVGRIGGLMGGIREERTPLEERLDALGRRLVWVTLAVGIVVVGVGVWRGEDFGRMVETGVALAIAAVPEGLPAVSTIALAVGVARMARRNALVRRLPAVEALGSATIVCTDKTGTLTAGEMTVTVVWTADTEFQFSGAGYDPEGGITADGADVTVAAESPIHLALRIGALTNRASLVHHADGWHIRGDPTEAALLVAARKAGLDRDHLHERWPETGVVPFSSERMMMATFHGDVGYVKGAPARVIERSTKMLTADGVVEMTTGMREAVLEQNQALASRGLRVLALATGPAGGSDAESLQDLTFVGFAGMSDPPASGVKATIERLHTAGIRTVMITGDQRLTAEAVARELGILRETGAVLEGHELGHIDRERLRDVSALSRVSPEDKLRIVEAFQQGGEVVAMLGDGVNDAAALKKANIGVAMGVRGTDVAKEAASVVLQDDRFETVGAAVEEGRVIFDNIRKFVFYLFSCNVAEVFVILGASVTGLPQPLLPLQILWLNLITDTFPALSLAAEPGEPGVMTRPPYDPQKAIMSAAFLRRIAFYGALITGVTLAAFVIALRGAGTDLPTGITIAFMTLALAQTFHLANARGGGPALGWRRIISNRWALGAALLTVALQFLAVYLAPLARLLGVVPLAPRDWLIVLPLAALPAVIGQVIALAQAHRQTEAVH